MLPKIGNGMEAMTKKVILKQLKEKNVRIFTSTKLSRIEDTGVVVVDKEDRRQSIDAEKVVIAIGTRPDTRLYDRIKSMGYEIHQIGDCLETRNAKEAIYESGVLGRKI